MKYPIHDTILRIVANLLTTRIFPVVFLFRKNRSKTMKSKIIIAELLCTIIAPPALAVTKCVALNGSNTTCTSSGSATGHTDWAATCTTNGVSTPISGIGICSSTSGTSIGQTATELDTSSTTDENLNCWCKMTSPAVSRWVFSDSIPLAGLCAEDCASSCASDVQLWADFRSALFGSLSD